MSKIVILESLGIPKEALERLEVPFIQEGHTFEHYFATKNVDLLAARLRDADAAILANMPLGRPSGAPKSSGSSTSPSPGRTMWIWPPRGSGAFG